MKALLAYILMGCPAFAVPQAPAPVAQAWELSREAAAYPVDIFETSLHESSLGPFNPSDIVVATDHGESRIQFLLSFKYRFISLEGLDWRIGSYRLLGLDFAYDG